MHYVHWKRCDVVCVMCYRRYPGSHHLIGMFRNLLTKGETCEFFNMWYVLRYVLYAMCDTAAKYTLSSMMVPKLWHLLWSLLYRKWCPLNPQTCVCWGGGMGRQCSPMFPPFVAVLWSNVFLKSNFCGGCWMLVGKGEVGSQDFFGLLGLGPKLLQL